MNFNEMTKTQKINMIMDDFEKSLLNLAKTKKNAKCLLNRKRIYLNCRDRLVNALHTPLKDD